jgi:hypothetical protein
MLFSSLLLCALWRFFCARAGKENPERVALFFTETLNEIGVDSTLGRREEKILHSLSLPFSRKRRAEDTHAKLEYHRSRVNYTV